ncbi:adenylosuccinate synthetase [Bradyrhizobium sediminis]|uniref:Adenylosuccinate synthetase n=1 Tax=Bradyrhizobium sediminis TaxID=2840469 RepID=A0A975RN61_9BRAD|nr:adenylosuccinate synthetase [Bradyrhizobium sediminis]QWG13408.1 adenylosuccinate synthetase [Bradyrhizobium sediminis]
MPISVVVGGQFGSEGKGKVAFEIARKQNAAIVVRVGGTNSGHTAVDEAGRTWALRQLPASILARQTMAILPAGAIIDPEILRKELDELKLDANRILVSPYATIIAPEDKQAERHSGLISQIGSTGSGTGAALIRRMGRQQNVVLAKDHPAIAPFIGDTDTVMREALNQNRWIVIEGSQGFGLSILHGGFYPKATSRDTTAGTFLGEAGLSPRDVGQITLVIRTFPIRVSGDSGPLRNETSWTEVAKTAGLPEDYCELTTATRKVRRVGTFDADLVKRAITINNPTHIVLNHFDYIDSGVRNHKFAVGALSALRNIETAIGRRIDFLGTSPSHLVPRENLGNSGYLSDLEKSTPT